MRGTFLVLLVSHLNHLGRFLHLTALSVQPHSANQQATCEPMKKYIQKHEYVITIQTNKMHTLHYNYNNVLLYMFKYIKTLLLFVTKCMHFVGLHCNNCITMHRMENINCINMIPTNTFVSTTYAKNHHSSTYKTPSTTCYKNKTFQ